MIVVIYEKGDTYKMDDSLIYDPFPNKKENKDAQDKSNGHQSVVK